MKGLVHFCKLGKATEIAARDGSSLPKPPTGVTHEMEMFAKEIFSAS
jgi:hypothetical protein